MLALIGGVLMTMIVVLSWLFVFGLLWLIEVPILMVLFCIGKTISAVRNTVKRFTWKFKPIIYVGGENGI
jgi:hypothetical protein